MTRAQECQNLNLLTALLLEPQRFYQHCRNFTSYSILALTYGYVPRNGTDPLGLVKIAEDAMAGFSLASEPGRWWVDVFPILRYLPASFPGASFQKVAIEMRKTLDQLYDVPYDFVLRSMAAGTATHSFVATSIEQSGGSTAISGDIIKAAAASLYSGGAETTPSALTSFFLAMVLYPDIQDKARLELDQYLPSESGFPTRLPSIDDRASLPYIQAIVQEVWRWQPSVPLGLPHVVTRDDEYNGYFIEKGTIVWANIWAILHDSKLFPNPETFRPERFLVGTNSTLASSRLEAVCAAFGFGRRICPGMYLAENSVFIAIATILTIFEILPCEEEPAKVEYDGFISHPRPFKCIIRPRSQHAENLLQSYRRKAN